MAANKDCVTKPTLGLGLVPIILTLLILGVQLFYFGDFTPPYSISNRHSYHGGGWSKAWV